MATIVTRAGKGSPLTHSEVDANFTNLNTDKYQSGDSPTFNAVTVTGTLALNADPTTSLEAATKQYVDTIAAAGLHYHAPVRVETDGTLPATYDNGSSGVGATLTNSGTQAALVIDGVTLSVNDRVLIYARTNAFENGVYYVSDTGSASTNWVLTRTTDTDSYGASDPDALGQGDAFFVLEGATGAGELYVMNTQGAITFGTTGIAFTQVAATAVYSAGTGLTLTGTEFAAAQDIATSASPTFAGLAVNGSISVTGTVDGRDVATDGTKLDGIEAGATADQSASEILTAVKTVDGSGSGLDADLLDGNEASAFSLASHNHTLDSLSNTTITANTSGEILKWNGTAWVNNTLAEAGIQPSGTALTTSTAFGGDVSGTYNAIVVANDSHTHAFDNLTGKTGGTGNYTTTGTMTAATFNATSTTNGGFQGIDADSATSPSFTWSADLNTGMYRPAADQIGFTTGGTVACTITGSNFNVVGTLNAPTVDTNSVVIGAGVTLTEATDRADLLKITSSTSTWGGIQISNTSNEFLWSFMGDGTVGGIYDDLSNAWAIQFDDGGEVRLYYAGAEKLNTLTGGVYVTGDFTASGNVTAYSDERLKTNIQTLDGALDKVKQLRGVSFEKDGRQDIGVIAQEVQAVVPEVVDTTHEYLSVAYGNMVGLLIEAIKEQQDQIDDLKARLGALE